MVAEEHSATALEVKAIVSGTVLRPRAVIYADGTPIGTMKLGYYGRIRWALYKLAGMFSRRRV